MLEYVNSLGSTLWYVLNNNFSKNSFHKVSPLDIVIQGDHVEFGFGW